MNVIPETRPWMVFPPGPILQRIAAIGLSLFIVGQVLARPVHASQTDRASQFETSLINGSFEQAENGKPIAWTINPNFESEGFAISLDPTDSVDGTQSVLIDSTNVLGDTRFATLNFHLDPVTYQGQRVRFRAAVRTDSLDSAGKAQLWLTVGRRRADGSYLSGAFDNMGNRPIQSSEWQHYDIIADVEQDATSLTVGILAFQKSRVWMDDATFEIIDAEQAEAVETTTSKTPMGIASKAPVQPFYSHWLWLALGVIGVLCLSQTKNGIFQRASLRFAAVYWILYSFPSPLDALLPFDLFTEFVTSYEKSVQVFVHWVSHTLLGMEGEMILPNGSGDTTYAYVHLLALTIVASVAALVWTGLDRRQTDPVWLRDLLRSYVRYVLALTMLSYGLGKAGFISTQFGTLQDWNLGRTFGESSPMGLVWTFMAASPAYTFFAGLAEVVGGVLLLFRRTTILGAIVVFGVMLNVVLLNFCYDVPVKLYSFHLWFMSVFLLLPNMGRISGLLLWNRATEPIDHKPPYTNSITLPVQRLCKLAMIVYLFGIPIYKHTAKEFAHEPAEALESEHLLKNRGFRWINEYPYHR